MVLSLRHPSGRRNPYYTRTEYRGRTAIAVLHRLRGRINQSTKKGLDMPATTEEKVSELAKMMSGIEEEVVTSYTLADAIREGSTVSDQAVGTWGTGERMCAMHAAVTAAAARGYLGF